MLILVNTNDQYRAAMSCHGSGVVNEMCYMCNQAWGMITNVYGCEIFNDANRETVKFILISGHGFHLSFLQCLQHKPLTINYLNYYLLNITWWTNEIWERMWADAPFFTKSTLSFHIFLVYTFSTVTMLHKYISYGHYISYCNITVLHNIQV